MIQRPGKLTAVCVIAILLGGIGLVVALSGVVGMLVPPYTAKQVPNPSTEAQKMQDLQLKMQKEIQAVAARWRVYQLGLLTALTVISAGLIAGGALSLGMKPAGAKILSYALPFAIPFDTARGILGLYISNKVAMTTARYMQEMVSISPGKNPPPEGLMSGIVQVVSVVVLVVTALWMIGKVCYYVLAALYLKRPHVKRLFEPGAIPTPPPLN